jgi:hypothetical protein
MSNDGGPDLLAQLIGTVAVIAIGAYVANALRQHPVLGAAASYLLAAVVKPELIVTAADLGL